MSHRLTPMTRFAVLAALGFAVTATTARAAEPAPTREQQRAEVEYMKFVADHHLMGTLMAELCENKAVSGRLERLCRRIDRAQSREIGLLEGWLDGWYGIDYSPDISEADAADLYDLAGLRGAEFDVALSRMFIEHHKQIIERSRAVLPKLYHKKLRQLAEDIIRTQSREIKEFEAVIESYDD